MNARLSWILPTLLCFCFQFLYSQKGAEFEGIDFERIKAEKNTIQYDLDALLHIANSRIKENKTIKAPKGATEFEKTVLFTRQLSVEGNHLEAIRYLRYLLDFKCYRTKGEEVYLKYLLAHSLKGIGSSISANLYFDEVFPEFLEYISSVKWQIYALNNFGLSLIQADSLKKAKSVFQAAINLAIEEKDSAALYRIRNNYGYTLNLMHQWDSAKAYFKEDQNNKYKNLNPILHAFAYGNYGVLMFKNEKYDTAIVYLKKEAELLNAIPSMEGLANTYYVMGNCFLKKQQLDSAAYYYHEGLFVSKKLKSLSQIALGYEKLLQIYAREKNDPTLVLLLKKVANYRDSIGSKSDLDAYENELRLFRYHQISREVRLSKDEFDELAAKNKDLGYLIIGLSILVLGLVGVVIVRIRSRKKLNETNNKLLDKNEELTIANQKLQEISQRNEVLLKELHHRVKNNLQMIISLFNLQQKTQSLSLKESDLFQVAKDRVYSIALVHKKIYQSGEFSSLNFKEYLQAFIDEIIKLQNQEITVNYNIDELNLSIDTAVPLGLIINELFTNSIKHSQRKEDLIITITLEKCVESCEFIYRDNGVGINSKALSDKDRKSIGLTVIDLLSSQLEATVSYDSPDEKQKGFWFSLKKNFDQ